MKEAITVLTVDDSALYRDLLRQCLTADARIELISQASSGKLAIPRVRYYKPDFVILDQEMPDLTGLEALRIIKEVSPETRVLMFCSASTEGADLALRALQEGAVDFIAKPAADGAEEISDYIRANVIEKIVELSEPLMRVVERPQTSPPVAVKRRANAPVSLCAVGISTGGPVALRRLLSLLPSGLRGCILIVQHMPPIFTAQLAASLQLITKLKVKEAAHGDPLEHGRVYIAPGGKQLSVRQRGGGYECAVTDDPPLYGCRPSVNVLFSSIARLPIARESMAVIMTGMGNDGTEGMKDLKEKGTLLLAQSKESCVVFGMPSQPIANGWIDEVGDIDQIARSVIHVMSGGELLAQR